MSHPSKHTKRRQRTATPASPAGPGRQCRRPTASRCRRRRSWHPKTAWSPAAMAPRRAAHIKPQGSAGGVVWRRANAWGCCAHVDAEDGLAPRVQVEDDGRLHAAPAIAVSRLQQGTPLHRCRELGGHCACGSGSGGAGVSGTALTSGCSKRRDPLPATICTPTSLLWRRWSWPSSRHRLARLSAEPTLPARLPSHLLQLVLLWQRPRANLERGCTGGLPTCWPCCGRLQGRGRGQQQGQSALQTLQGMAGQKLVALHLHGRPFFQP